MRVFAVSDLHTDFAENRRRLQEISSTSYSQDVLGVAGQELLPYLDKPFVFFGHSLGALLYFETARSLRREERNGVSRRIFSSLRLGHPFTEA